MPNTPQHDPEALEAIKTLASDLGVYFITPPHVRKEPRPNGPALTVWGGSTFN